jgi:hypothetical protein
MIKWVWSFVTELQIFLVDFPDSREATQPEDIARSDQLLFWLDFDQGESLVVLDIAEAIGALAVLLVKFALLSDLLGGLPVNYS